MPTSALAYAASASLGANSRLLSVRAFTSAPAAATLAIVLRWNRRARRPRRATCETACWEIPVGRDDPGPPNVKFSADFLAYKNLRRGGYQPPGSRKRPHFGRIISAPTTSLHHISHGIHSEAECTGGLLQPLRRPPANPHPMSRLRRRADVGRAARRPPFGGQPPAGRLLGRRSAPTGGCIPRRPR